MRSSSSTNRIVATPRPYSTGRVKAHAVCDVDRACSSPRRRRIAAAWAGKPSWSARATIDGPCRASAVASARATAVRLRNASAVMPDDTWAKPLVGSDAGQPITKLAALNGVCWPTRISPALTSASTTRVDRGVGDRDLQVLGRVAVGDRDRLVERVDEHAAAVGAERRARGRRPARRAGRRAGGPARRRSRSASVGRRGDEHDRRVGAVLGLDQQVGGEAHRVGACRRRSRRSRSGRAASSWRRRSAASRPGRSVTAGEPGPDDLAHLGDRLACRTRARRCRPAR